MHLSFIILCNFFFKFSSASPEEINWRYYPTNTDTKKIEASNWFQLEYVNKSEWNSRNLSWYYQSRWCEISRSNLAITSGRCKLHGEYAFGIQNGSSITLVSFMLSESSIPKTPQQVFSLDSNSTGSEKRVLIVHFSHMFYSWEARSSINRASDELNVDLFVWINVNEAQSERKLQNEHTNQITELFFSNGERPILEIRNILKSSKSLMIKNPVFVSNESAWRVNFKVPSDTQCVFAKIKSSTTYSLFDKFVRETTHIIRTDNFTIQSASQGLSLKTSYLKSSLLKIVKDPCSAQKAAFLSSSGIYLTWDLWQNSSIPIQSINMLGDIVDDLVYTGDSSILVLINSSLASIDSYLETRIVSNGLPNNISSIHVADRCHEIGKWRNIVIAISANNSMNSTSWLYISYDSGMNFVQVPFPGWKKMLEGTSINLAVQEFQVLKARVHSVLLVARFLITIKLSHYERAVLVDYCYFENKWKLTSTINLDGLIDFEFLLSTSMVLWSHTVLIEQQENSTVILWNCTSYKSRIKNLLTDNNGRYVIELASNELFAGMVGVNGLVKISSVVSNANSIQLSFDASGRLSVTEKFLYNGTITMAAHFYPLVAEIDSAARGIRCKVVSFSHNVKQGWYELDMGQNIQITVVIVSLSSEPELKILRPAEDKLNLTTSQSSVKLGKYTEKKMVINISISDMSSSTKRINETFTTMVFYLSNITMECTNLSPQTAFFHLGCPSSSRLVLNKTLMCKEDHLSTTNNTIQEPDGNQIANKENGSDVKYCASVMMDGVLRISVSLQNTESSQNVPPALLFEEIYQRKDFSAVEPVFKDRRELHELNYVTYDVTFHGSGEFHLKFSTKSRFSFCYLQAFVNVTVGSQTELSSSVYVLTSVCLGISISFVLLVISFLLYRRNTLQEHEREAEIIKRQQELRYLTNLQDFRENISTAGGGRRRSSALKEGLRKRNSSLSAISEAE